MTPLPPPTDPPDWDLLTALFANGTGEFRHQMGLRRGAARDFYRRTPDADSIAAEKAAILARPDASLYRLESPEGNRALAEFTALLGGEESEDRDAAIRGSSRISCCSCRRAGNSAGRASAFRRRWSLEGKLHEPVTEIHGVVPALNAQLGRQIALFFERLAPGGADSGWRRTNWGLAASAARNQHPSLALPRIPASARPDDLFLRLENQHFMKLPDSGAIAFGIRIATHRLAEIIARPEIRAGLRERLRTMPEAISDYKGIPPDLWRALF